MLASSVNVVDVSEATPTLVEVATEQALANELLAACLGQLSLRMLPHVSRVNHRWKEAAQVAFEWQLRWRAEARCAPLPLPVPAIPTRAQQGPGQIHHAGFSLAFLQGGDLVVQIVDMGLEAIRTFSFANGVSLQPHEGARREFADHGPFNAAVGGIIGYRKAMDGMTFFPMASEGGTAASAAVWVADGNYQNVLQAGNIIFLLRRHARWWEEERLTADLLDTDSGGRATVDVTPLRDALKGQLAQDRPARGAVSAADGHFIFHLNTRSGAKVAAALRLPAHISPHHALCTGSVVDSEIAFARRWPTTHAIARLRTPNEEPCGDFLMLWSDNQTDLDVASTRRESGRRLALRVVVALLHASTGVAVGRELIAPALDGSHASVAEAFLHGGIAAIAYNAASGVVAACSLPRTGLPPPAVLVWDWRSSMCLQAVLFHPLPQPPECVATQRGPRPLRFPLGARVECRMGTSLWSPGVVAAHYVEVPGQQPLPYLVHLDGGDACYAHLDRPDLIRAAADGEEFAYNDRTQAMEVAATASLVIHPASSRLAIGLWHNQAAAGVLFSVDIGPQ